MKPATALLSGLLIGGPLLTPALLAAEWERGAGVSLGTYYSDNICRSASEREGRGAFTARPDIYLRGQGARANIYLQGAVTYDSLADSDFDCPAGQGFAAGNREAFMPSLRYRGTYDLINEWLTLESDASARRNPVNPFAPGGSDDLDGRDNINITYQYGAGAVVQRRLADSADLRMRYYRNEQYNRVNQFGDSSEHRGEFDLGTERGANRLSVGIAGFYSKVMYEGTELRPAFDNKMSSAEARAALRATPSWQLTGRVGEEWNTFTSLNPDIDGTFWSAGARWSPNDRVEINLGTGQRFFGTTPYANIRYRHQRSQVSADYMRSLTFPRTLRGAPPGTIDPFDPDFDPDFDPGVVPGDGQLPGLPPGLIGEPTFIGDTPIINERLSLRYRFTARRTTITATASDSRQRRVEDLADARFTNLGLAFSRSLSSNLSMNASLNWGERVGRGGDLGLTGPRSENWRAGFGFNRQVGNNTTARLDFRHTRWESDAGFNEYRENRVTLSARHQFW